ncbi:unnamed protein product [Rotaria sp. Silwood1]|nr:unnamed protein product [Rotaria sp. Silwood1]
MHLALVQKIMYLFSNIVIVILVHLTISSLLTDAFRDNAEECCETGRIQAETDKTCTLKTHLLTSNNDTNITNYCPYLTHICCLSNLRNYYCEEGVNTALRLLPCNETKLHLKDTYKICCRCCELGVQAGRHLEDCDPVPILDERCGEQFTNCCKKAKSLNCDPGFEMGDNARCRDINECLSSPCPKTMTCENTPGSYQCIEGCESGYTWSLKYGECRDTDECALHTHNCTHGQRCENMPGSFRCIRERNCGTGYQVDPQTQTCTDIDECEQGIDECRQVIKNVLFLEIKCLTSKILFYRPGYICKNYSKENFIMSRYPCLSNQNGSINSDTLHDIEVAGYRYVILTICIFGIVCNILNLCVLLQRRLKESPYTYLTGLAVADMLTLISISPFSIVLGDYIRH